MVAGIGVVVVIGDGLVAPVEDAIVLVDAFLEED